MRCLWPDAFVEKPSRKGIVVSGLTRGINRKYSFARLPFKKCLDVCSADGEPHVGQELDREVFWLLDLGGFFERKSSLPLEATGGTGRRRRWDGLHRVGNGRTY